MSKNQVNSKRKTIRLNAYRWISTNITINFSLKQVQFFVSSGFLLSTLCFRSSDLFSQCILPCYILPSWCHLHHTRVGWVRGIPSCPIQHLLEPPTSSCKAVSSLFRHHLHINAARELVERQLMWRQLLLKIFVYFFFLTLGPMSHLQW